MEDRHLPRPTTSLLVDLRGAEIVDEDDVVHPETSDIYLPKHTEYISHIAIDIGGSLAKVVYFTRAPESQRNRARRTTPPSSVLNGLTLSSASESTSPDPSLSAALADSEADDDDDDARLSASTSSSSARSSSKAKATQPNGILTPKLVHEPPHRSGQDSTPRRWSSSSVNDDQGGMSMSISALRRKLDPEASADEPPAASSIHMRRRSSTTTTAAIPGGRLNFIKFETAAIASECIPFISNLIHTSADVNGVPLDRMRSAVQIMATGGGAHMYFDLLQAELGVEVRREDEMDCLIGGLNFLTEIPFEVFWYSDELVQHISHRPRPSDPTSSYSPTPNPTPRLPSAEASLAMSPSPSASSNKDDDLPRPSPNPPQYSLLFDSQPNPQFPFMLVNIGSGVSMIKVDAPGAFSRISGTSLGGGTLWGLLSLLTGAKTFDEMLDASLKGDNAGVDMLVGDIYGQDYGKIGLKSSTIASSFGKVFRKGKEKRDFRPEDISRSLLYAISNNIGQIAFLNAEKYGLDRIYFGGCFIRGHAATVSTLSYAIRFWSKGTKRAFFLRHEGYLGAVGAWLKNVVAKEEASSRLTAPPAATVTATAGMEAERGQRKVNGRTS